MRSGSHLRGSKRSIDNSETKEPKRHAGSGVNQLHIIGLGPGDPEFLTIKAKAALERSDVIIGYKTYIEQIKPIFPDKKLETSGMTHEIDRAGRAIEQAMSGKKTALVSGGDPGIYAMAGLVFEMARQKNIRLGHGPDELDVIVMAGVPALAAAAAILGAPLNHDFASISLSDRLTDWEVIAKRLDLAAQADFVIVFYNPKSKGRPDQFGRALEIVSRHRPGATPVGVVKRATRSGQTARITTLNQALNADVDMQTVVIIGNTQTFVYDGRMATPRGYIDKYRDEIMI